MFSTSEMIKIRVFLRGCVELSTWRLRAIPISLDTRRCVNCVAQATFRKKQRKITTDANLHRQEGPEAKSPQATMGSNSQEDSQPIISQAQIILAAEDFVKHHFASHDPSHDWHHVHRVRLFALHLSQDPCLPSKPNMLVLELAALFHDMCDKKYLKQEGKSVSAKSVLEPFFTSLHYPNDTSSLISEESREKIEKIVDNVSWSKEESRRQSGQSVSEWENTCPEYWCVSDSDRLDAIGSIGTLRTAAYSAVKGQPLHIPPNNPQQDSVPPAEQAEGYNSSCIAHFHDKLLKIKEDRLKTDWARKEAQRRQNMMQNFLMELDLEWLMTSQGQQHSLVNIEDTEQ